MSLRSEWEGFKEAIPAAYWKFIVSSSLLFFSGDYAELASDTYLSRDSLPEPFDIADHIGNTREAAMGTMAAFAIFGTLKLLGRNRETVLKNVPRVAVGAFAASSAVQVIGEHFELTNQVLGGHNTGDMIDAAYGIGWSGLVAYGAMKLFTSAEQKLHERSEARNEAFDAQMQAYDYAEPFLDETHG